MVWVVLLLATGFAAKSIGESLSDNLTLPGTDSQAATDLLNDKFPDQANGMVPVIFVAPSGGDVNDSKYKDAITTAYDHYKDSSEVISATSPYSDAGADQLSKDKSTAYIAITPQDSPSDMTLDGAQSLLDKATPAASTGLQVSIGSYPGQQLSKPSSTLSEVIGLVAAVIILLLTFGTLVAMAMPITTAIFGAWCRAQRGGIDLHIRGVPTSAPASATMIGLGVGVDYELL